MRKILVTNDDGIQSDGIRRLAEAAKKFGEVWVVAPLNQCSAMSHSINLRNPVDVYKVDFPVEGVHAYGTTGTPADCVRVGHLNILKGETDIVLSGINYGYNSGSDTQYSATVGAAMEGAFSGVHSIALSEGFSECHEVTDAYLEKVLEELIAAPIQSNQIWNVNFPCVKLADCKGILRNRKVALNSFFDDHYDEEELSDGGIRMTVKGIYKEDASEGTDFKGIVDGYVTIGTITNLS